METASEACEKMAKSIHELMWVQGVSLLATLIVLVAILAR